MANIRTMKSMELRDDEKIDFCAPIQCDRPDYPYGLQISLTEKELDKLGLDPAGAELGGIIHGHFMGRITSLSANDGEHGSHCRIEVQIESLAIESEDDENEENEASERG